MVKQVGYTLLFSHRLFWGLCLVWTGIIVTSYAWTFYYEREHSLSLMRASAESIAQMDIEYRHWNAKHGGVYVPVTKETPPNPFLSHIPERDVTTPSGKKLTLINPAYMLRQVHEMMAEKEGGIRAHITSMNLIREENRADAWEEKALRRFEQGESEITSIEVMEDGKTYFRFIKAMIAEKACLKCHGWQGYKVGDVRGGLSVSLPIDNQERSMTAALSSVHAVLWMVGLGFITVNYRRRVIAQYLVRKREAHIRLLLDSTAEAIYGLDCEGNCTFANSACLSILGYESGSEVMGKNMHDLIHHTRPDGSHYPVKECKIYEAFVLGKATHVDDELLWRKDGTSFDAEYWSYPIREDHEITGAVVTFLDISSRRLSDQKAEQRLDELERFQKVAVEREFRIKELRDEVEALNAELKQFKDGK